MFTVLKKIIPDEEIAKADRIYAAYSGGIDSHVLLHLCAADARMRSKLIAVYVNHGLQVEADAWKKHCALICNKLDIHFIAVRANASAAQGESPEEAARNARYSALEDLLTEGGIMLMAQHAEDQLETVLLQLFRGSGLKGLSAMPQQRAFGKGVLIRPLLTQSKADIIEHARRHGLQWIEDPSNKQNKYDRNFLRNSVLPLLKQRWPALDSTVSRAARHCTQAQGIVNHFADSLYQTVVNQDNTLNIAALQQNPLDHQRLLVRQWFQALDLKLPSDRVVHQILHEIVAAKPDARPLLTTQGREIRRYRNKLYCLKPELLTLAKPLIWPLGASTLRLTNTTVYAIEPSSAGITKELWLKAQVTVKLRAGGELIHLPGRDGAHELKKLFQEAGIPPWQRGSIPLFYLDGQLAAVGEYWIAAPFYTVSNSACLRIVSRNDT